MYSYRCRWLHQQPHISYAELKCWISRAWSVSVSLTEGNTLHTNTWLQCSCCRCIASLHNVGLKVLSDIVINHRCASKQVEPQSLLPIIFQAELAACKKFDTGCFAKVHYVNAGCLDSSSLWLEFLHYSLYEFQAVRFSQSTEEMSARFWSFDEIVVLCSQRSTI